jgi:hypothetical protein
MPFEFQQSGRVVMIHWTVAPRSGDMAEIVRRVTEVRRTTSPIGIVEIVTETSGVAKPDVIREAVVQARPLRHLREIHAVVIEGDSRRRAIVRGVVSLFAFALGEDIVICTRAREAIARVCRKIGEDESNVTAHARGRGWIRDDSRPSPPEGVRKRAV